MANRPRYRNVVYCRMRKLYWTVSGRQQVLLSLLAASLFLIQLAPLELQRRIVNDATDKVDFTVIAWLCLAYFGVVVLEGGLKFAMNVYRGSVSEAANQRLRLEANPAAKSGAAEQSRSEAGCFCKEEPRSGRSSHSSRELTV